MKFVINLPGPIPANIMRTFRARVMAEAHLLIPDAKSQVWSGPKYDAIWLKNEKLIRDVKEIRDSRTAKERERLEHDFRLGVSGAREFINHLLKEVDNNDRNL